MRFRVLAVYAEVFNINNVLCIQFSQHAEMTDETVQHKTLQTILIIFQSKLHPESEVRHRTLISLLQSDDFITGLLFNWM